MARVAPVVLIVDDEPDIREMLRMELGARGFEVQTAPSGPLAVQAARQRALDVVLTDLRMPEMDGAALVSALRDADPSVAVIVGTGYASIASAIDCMRRGAFDYVQKPYDLDELELLVRRAAEHRHLRSAAALGDVGRALLAAREPAKVIETALCGARRLLNAEAVAFCGPEGAPIRQGGAISDEVLARACRGDSVDASVLILPLEMRDPGRSALVASRAAGFGAGERELGRALATEVALALDAALAHRALEERLAELVATRESLVHAEHLAMIGRLAGLVAHEVNNPLAALQMTLGEVRASTETLLDAAASCGNAPGLATIQQIREDLDFLDGIVPRIAEPIAALSSLQHTESAPEREPIELRTLLAEIHGALAPGARERVVLCAGAPLWIHAGPRDLRTGIARLLEGFPPAEGGALEVRAERTGDSEAAILLHHPSLALDAAQRLRVFDPKLAVRGATMRLDLSLAAGYQALRRAGGQIEIADPAGEGTVLRILLPLAPGKAS